MTKFKVTTDTGFCGTDTEYIEDFDSKEEAEEWGWEQLQGELSVCVEEIEWCYICENEEAECACEHCESCGEEIYEYCQCEGE